MALLSVSTHIRYNKAPVYTSDKRAKFNQNEHRRWIRFATVIGYLISICIPALALTVYYVGFWDPKYERKISPFNATLRNGASISSRSQPYGVFNNGKCHCPVCQCPTARTTNSVSYDSTHSYTSLDGMAANYTSEVELEVDRPNPEAPP